MSMVISHCTQARWGQSLRSGNHSWQADQNKEAGGQDQGPDPHALLASALAACTGMTVWMYASRKAWSLEDVQVQITMRHDTDVTVLLRQVVFVGPQLDAAQRQRLLAIADRCPIHKLLTGAVRIETTLAGA